MIPHPKAWIGRSYVSSELSRSLRISSSSKKNLSDIAPPAARRGAREGRRPAQAAEKSSQGKNDCGSRWSGFYGVPPSRSRGGPSKKSSSPLCVADLCSGVQQRCRNDACMSSGR